MRKSILAVVMIALVTVVVLVGIGCAAPKPTPTPVPTATLSPTVTPRPTPTVGPAATSGPAPTAAPVSTPRPTATVAGPTATPGKVFNWKLMTLAKSSRPDVEHFKTLIEEKSGGRIKVQIFEEGEHPYRAGDYLPALKERAFDLGPLSSGVSYAYEPMLSALDLPFLNPGDGEEYYALFEALRGKYWDPIHDKYNTMVLDVFNFGTIVPNIKDRFILSFKDMESLKLRAYNKAQADLYTAMGATAVTLSWSDVYTALQRGTVDGLFMSIPATYDAKFYEVVKYITLGGFVKTLGGLGLNKDAFNELPADLKEIVLQVAKENDQWARKWFVDADTSKLLKAITNYGVRVASAPSAFQAEVAKRAEGTVWTDFLQKTGAPGAALVEDAKKFHQEWIKTH